MAARLTAGATIGYDFRVTTNGKEYVAAVGRFATHMQDLRPALVPYVRDAIRNAMQWTFEHGGQGLRGGGWKALSNTPWMDSDKMVRPGYLDWKKGTYASRWKGLRGDGSWWAYRGPQGTFWPSPLSLSGRMHESLTTTAGAGGVWATRATGFLYGTRVRKGAADYPRYHALGMGRNPKRDFLDWDMNGAGKGIWTRAIMDPVRRYMRIGLQHLEKYGVVDDMRLLDDVKRATHEHRNG